MSKNRSKKQQNRDRRKAKRAARDDSNVVPLSGRPESSPPSLIPAGFGEWAAAELSVGDAASLDGFLVQLEILLAAAAGENPEFDTTGWTIDDVDAMGSFIELMVEAGSIELDQARFVAYAGMMLAVFLVDHGRWTGDPDAPTYAQERLTAAVGLSLGTTEIAPVDEAVERAALLATQPLARITVLLDWLGDGQPTTPNRWLRPAAARELAAALGLEMPPDRTSMSNHSPLRNLWLHAQATALIEVNTVRATPEWSAATWQEAPVEALRGALTVWIESVFPDDVEEFAEQFYDSLAAVILTGCTNSATSPADIDGWVEKLGYSEPLVRALHSQLSKFVDEGWLTVESDTYVVPEALRPAVVPAIPQPGMRRSATGKAASVPH